MSCINVAAVSGSRGEAGPVHPRQPKASRWAIHRPPCLASVSTEATKDEEAGADLLTWIGKDERGRRIEIVAPGRPDRILVIRVMSTHYRGNKP